MGEKPMLDWDTSIDLQTHMVIHLRKLLVEMKWDVGLNDPQWTRDASHFKPHELDSALFDAIEIYAINATKEHLRNYDAMRLSGIPRAQRLRIFNESYSGNATKN